MTPSSGAAATHASAPTPTAVRKRTLAHRVNDYSVRTRVLTLVAANVAVVVALMLASVFMLPEATSR